LADGTGNRSQTPEADRRDNADEAYWEGGSNRDVPPPWEWGVAFLGLALVLAVLGFMTYQAVTGDDSAPQVTVYTESILPLNSGYLVQIRAVNQGGSTAAHVVVEGRLTGENERVEMGETVLDYVPSHSSRKGGLFFSQDPRKYSLQLRAEGYAEP
jgi:uncharacterized protein (TIGR02588 family)